MRRLLTLLLTTLLAMTVCTINVSAEEKTLKLDVTYVVENTLPKIEGAKDKTIFVGEKFDALKGVSATDAEDGELKVDVTGEVNINKAGKYDIKYSTSDNDGGVVSQTVTITVIEKLIDSKDTFIETDTKVETGSPVNSVSTEMNSDVILESLVREEDSKENKSSELTASQKQAIKDGANVSIDLVVNESSATDEDEKKIEQKVKDNNSDTQIGTLLDISLLCTVTQNNTVVGDPSKITSTSEPVKVTVTVPDELVNNDSTVTRDYDVARLHDGKVDLLGATYDAANKKLTFSTTKFSTYAIVYTDTKVEQPKNNTSSSSSSSYKKPVVNTAGLNISVTDGLKFNPDNTESEFSILFDSSDFDGKAAFVTVSGLELTSEKGDKVTLDVEYISSALYLAGEYPINVKVVDDAKKPGVYKGTLKVTVNYEEGVALVGDKVYLNLKEAFDSMDSDSTLILLKDVHVEDTGWSSIGTQDSPFSGTIKGNNKKISGLNNCLIKYATGNINIDDLNIEINFNDDKADFVGGLIGVYDTNNSTNINAEVLINNVDVTGSIIAKDKAGGIIGSTYNSSVGNGNDIDFKLIDCTNSATVTAKRAGGLIGTSAAYLKGDEGNNNFKITIDGCENTAAISSLTNSDKYRAGGFIGYCGGYGNYVFNSIKNSGTDYLIGFSRIGSTPRVVNNHGLIKDECASVLATDDYDYYYDSVAEDITMTLWKWHGSLEQTQGSKDSSYKYVNLDSMLKNDEWRFTIDGKHYKFASSAVHISGIEDGVEQTSHVEISDNPNTYAINGISVEYVENKSMNISGEQGTWTGWMAKIGEGTYNFDPKDYIPHNERPNYTITENENGTWTVVKATESGE